MVKALFSRTQIEVAVGVLAAVTLGFTLSSSDLRPVASGTGGVRIEQFGHKETKRFDQPAEAEQFFLQKRLAAGEKHLDTQRYVEALAHMERMPQYSTKLGRELGQDGLRTDAVETWEPLGPGNIGGRTRRLVIDPSDVDTMYAGGVGGGVWKTTDGGTTWAPLDDMMPNLAVSSLVMDPADNTHLLAGTGEGFNNADAIRGAGIFETTDSGATWAQVASTATTDFFFVNDIVFSPTSSLRIYAATRTGLHRSLDGGASWTKVIDPNTPTDVRGCHDIAIKSTGPADTVFAACGNFAQATIFRNTDAGAAGTWDAVFTEAGMGRTSLAIAPSNENTIYGLSSSLVAGPDRTGDAVGDYTHGMHAVFRSTMNGDIGSWTARVRNNDLTVGNTLLLTNAPFAVCLNSFPNQGWYDNIIAVDPVDENIVWAGGIDLFRSNDGGANWGIASLWFANPASPFFNHADQHNIIFPPGYDGTTNQTMFTTNDGGIFKTVNARAAVDPVVNPNVCDTSMTTIVVAWQELNNGYEVTQFYHGTAYPDAATFFGGTQDNGTVRGTLAGGIDTWAMINGGDGGYTAVDPGNTQILYAENTRYSIRKSTNGGASFALATSGISGDNGAAFITPFTMDPSNASRLWIGGWFIWRTTNAAGSWVRASALTDGAGSVSAIAVAPSNPNRVLVGMSDGFIHRNDAALAADSTTDWPSIQPQVAFVSSIAFDPTNDLIAYATFTTFGSIHVMKTVDGGATWAALTGTAPFNLPDIPFHSIAVDPTDPKRLYVGSDLGVFMSATTGTKWMVENTGYAKVMTDWLDIQDATGGQRYVYAFTHGRSAWRVPVEPTAIFADGFESGNSSAWSITTP